VGDATRTTDGLWAISYAKSGYLTYMVAVGQEMNSNGITEYPESGAIPCDLVTRDPTKLPTKAPSTPPTNYPTNIPTTHPTFELPEIGFVETNVLTGDILYNIMEGSSGIEIQIYQYPVSLYPIAVAWEILDSNNQPVSDVFNQTSGVVSFKEYRTNYITEGPCSEFSENCISGYDCLSHMGNDYCVKNVQKVYEKIYISANDDGIENPEPRRFQVVFRSPGFYSNNEFYYNKSQNTIHNYNNNATVVLFDSASKAFCEASPTSGLCLTGQRFAFEIWHWIIFGCLILGLILAGVVYKYQTIVAKLALRQKQLAQEALSNEVIIGEEGFGPGMSTHVNPLALRSPKKPRRHTLRVTPTVSEESDDDVVNFLDRGRAFSEEKTQFIPTPSKKKKKKKKKKKNEVAMTIVKAPPPPASEKH